MSRTPSPIYLDASEAQQLPPTLPRSRRKRIVFGWYGGKFNHLEWLLPLLPKAHHYCEPFAGSGAVLLNREPSPVETYNDIDGEVVNFFRVLRDQGPELQRAIALTPFAREEFHHAITAAAKDASDLERARRFSCWLGRRARSWRRAPRWGVGPTAKTPAGQACPASCRAGWAALKG